MSDEKTVTEKQLVVFTLGTESYGVDIAVVREIIRLQSITRVPGTPLAVEGVINLRGSVIPVVDLRKRFELDGVQRDNNSRIVVVYCRGRDIGIIVDSVAEVLRVPVNSIEPPDSVVSGGCLDYLTGIAKISGRLVILLDMDLVLSRQEVAEMNAVEAMKDNGGKINQQVEVQANSKEVVKV